MAKMPKVFYTDAPNSITGMLAYGLCEEFKAAGYNCNGPMCMSSVRSGIDPFSMIHDDVWVVSVCSHDTFDAPIRPDDVKAMSVWVALVRLMPDRIEFVPPQQPHTDLAFLAKYKVLPEHYIEEGTTSLEYCDPELLERLHCLIVQLYDHYHVETGNDLGGAVGGES